MPNFFPPIISERLLAEVTSYIQKKGLKTPKVGQEYQPAQGRQSDVNLLLAEGRNTNRSLDFYLAAIEIKVNAISEKVNKSMLKDKMERVLVGIKAKRNEYFVEAIAKLKTEISEIIKEKNISENLKELIQQCSQAMASYNIINLKPAAKSDDTMEFVILEETDSDSQKSTEKVEKIDINTDPEIEYLALQYEKEYMAKLGQDLNFELAVFSDYLEALKRLDEKEKNPEKLFLKVKEGVCEKYHQQKANKDLIKLKQEKLSTEEELKQKLAAVEKEKQDLIKKAQEKTKELERTQKELQAKERTVECQQNRINKLENGGGSMASQITLGFGRGKIPINTNGMQKKPPQKKNPGNLPSNSRF